MPTEGLRAFATLLRVYHETVADFEPTNHEWALSTQKPGFDEIICHGDFGPWNLVWNGFEPVGILDWDFAHPAPTTYDVAYALEYVAPFRADDECVKWLSYPAPPDRRHRIEVFADGYGLSTTQHLVDQVISTQEAQILHVKNLSDKGLHPQVEWVNSGFLGELTARVEWTRAHRNLFE